MIGFYSSTFFVQSFCLNKKLVQNLQLRNPNEITKEEYNEFSESSGSSLSNASTSTLPDSLVKSSC